MIVNLDVDVHSTVKPELTRKHHEKRQNIAEIG